MFTPAITPVSLYALLIGIDFYLPNRLSDGTKYSHLGGLGLGIECQPFSAHLNLWEVDRTSLTTSNK